MAIKVGVIRADTQSNGILATKASIEGTVVAAVTDYTIITVSPFSTSGAVDVAFVCAGVKLGRRIRPRAIDIGQIECYPKHNKTDHRSSKTGQDEFPSAGSFHQVQPNEFEQKVPKRDSCTQSNCSVVTDHACHVEDGRRVVPEKGYITYSEQNVLEYVTVTRSFLAKNNYATNYHSQTTRDIDMLTVLHTGSQLSGGSHSHNCIYPGELLNGLQPTANGEG